MSLGSWGSVVFEVTADRLRTWTDMRRSGEARYAEHEVHLGKPLSEFLGPGLDQITFSVRLDAARGVDPADEIEELQEARDSGEVRTLLIADEVVFDCTLRAMNEQHTRHDGKGGLLVATVELTFKEYV